MITWEYLAEAVPCVPGYIETVGFFGKKKEIPTSYRLTEYDPELTVFLNARGAEGWELWRYEYRTMIWRRQRGAA